MIQPFSFFECLSALAVSCRYMKPVNGFTSSFHRLLMRSHASGANTPLKMT